MPKSTSGVTITDVARAAGVSLSTVSRAMNGKPTVDPALAERVRAVAAELGYAANPLARSLVLGRTQTVAVLIPDLANPTFQAILRGISRAAAGEGYHVLIADTAEVVADEPGLASAIRRRTDGVILCAPRMDEATLSALLPSLAPAVVVNRPPGDAPTVSADYRDAMSALIDHLAGLGHRRVAYLSGVVGSASGAARQAAIADAGTRHPDLEIVEIPAGVDFDSGARAADAVLAAGVTGVLAFNDLVAMGLLSAVSARGVHVPGDMSIAGFDDIPFASYTTPPLTTAAVPAAEIGAFAWEAMSAQLSDTATDAGSVRLTPRLVVRASTAPAP